LLPSALVIASIADAVSPISASTRCCRKAGVCGWGPNGAPFTLVEQRNRGGLFPKLKQIDALDGERAHAARLRGDDAGELKGHGGRILLMLR
jgi:hypothetical protein